MIQKNLRVTAQTVIAQMLEGHKTFSDLAEKYGMTEAEFKTVAARVVNDRDYPRLVKADARYRAIREGMTKRKKISSKPIENHVAENLDTIAERDALEEKLKRVDKEVEERIKNQQKKEENLENAESKLKQAKEVLEKASYTVTTAEKECKQLRLSLIHI